MRTAEAQSYFSSGADYYMSEQITTDATMSSGSFDPLDLPMSAYHLLQDLAGVVDVELIAEELKLTPTEVRQAAEAFGFNLSITTGKRYCSHCCEVRVMRRASDGAIECPVCAVRELTESAVARERAAYMSLPISERAAIAANKRSRGARKSKASVMVKPASMDVEARQRYDLAQELTRYRRVMRRAQRYEERARVIYGGARERVPLAAIPADWSEQQWLHELAVRGKLDKLRDTGPWRELRDRLLQERPMCDCCGTLPSTTVRSVRNPKIYLATALSETYQAKDGSVRRNMLALCSKCAADKAERWKIGTCDRSVNPPKWNLDGRAVEILECE